MKQNLQHPEQLPFNKNVREAYYLILKKAKQALATIVQEELRFSLERESRSIQQDSVIHELVNPLLYLRLECEQDGLLSIHYGFEEVINQQHYSKITSAFVRSIYYYTGKEQTTINIEAAVKTNWLIKTCSEMYEYIEERNKYHTFKQIAYKPAAVKRKQLLSVA